MESLEQLLIQVLMWLRIVEWSRGTEILTGTHVDGMDLWGLRLRGVDVFMTKINLITHAPCHVTA
jgi:hypothetical protein